MFAFFILPIIFMVFKKNRLLQCHFYSLIIINFTAFYTYHLTLWSLLYSVFILEILFLHFIYMQICRKSGTGLYKATMINLHLQDSMVENTEKLGNTLLKAMDL